MSEIKKAAVSVSEMSRMIGLSRARFYQLLAENILPKPSYDPETNRPYYDEEGQAQCLEVKRRNVGVNGKVIVFYASRHRLTGQPKRTPKPKIKPTPTNQYTDLIELLDELHLSASAEQVEAAVVECFPDGIQKLNLGEVVPAVIRHLKRQESPR